MPAAHNTVLIVDDKECVRSALSLTLAELGYSVRTAVDGFSALGDHPKAAIDDQVKSGHREKA